MGSSTSKTVVALLWYLCAIIILYSSMSHGNSNAGCDAKDRETLEIFKGSIEDPWKLLSSWSTEQDCCHWFGVQCDNLTRRVTKLDLHCQRYYSSDDDNCLGGQINLYVLKLEFLSFLDLHDNDFNAIYIPPIDHNMSIIRHGTNLSNLLFLDFSHNMGLKIDDLRWVSQLSSLKYLNLSDANLSKETLWLERVNMLPSLLVLGLSHCSLKSIQPSLEHVNSSYLEVLDISHNDFYSEVPELLFNLSSSISFLDLSFSYLKGQMSKELSNFRQLKRLVLRFNNFEGSIPAWVGQYTQLEHLDLSSNFFSGPIPETLVNLSSLVHLDVEGNFLNGSLPKSLGQLSELQGFFAGNNKLSGSISPFLCEAMIRNNSLEVLLLSHNLFSGKLLDCWIHGKTHLKVINLRLNNFSGTIPPQICQLSNLQFLDLANNNLSGSIPKCLDNSTHLKVIILRLNNFSGSIPPQICQLSNLQFLDLANNNLSGSIPKCLGNSIHLKVIILRLNNFSGSIPSQICQLSNLQVLVLANNKLSGSIPKCLGNSIARPITSLHDCLSDSSRTYEEYQHLFYGDCGEHDLSDNVNQFSFRLMFSNLDLSMNDLSGLIPLELFRSGHFTFLNLSHNGLIGSIPDEIGHMGILEALDLSWNQLVGEIPQSMTDLDSLAVLDLSHNNLSGKIPLGTQLQSFDASSYMDNPGLYGAPLPNNKPQGEKPIEKKEIIEGKDDEFTKCLKMGMAIGFAYGFWGTCLALFFIKTWRIAYFRFLTHIYDQIYVFVALKAKWLRRNLTKSPN